MELKSIVRELLANNDYVSLPSLGSFVQQYESAKLAPDGKTIMPPQQIVTFDSTRTFNDEILEQYLKEKLGVPYNEAAKLVIVLVSQIKDSLQLGKEVEFDNVGTLSQSETGQILFQQVDENHRVSSAFGLQSIEIKQKMVSTPLKASAAPRLTPPQKPLATGALKRSTAENNAAGLQLILVAAVMAIVLLVVGMMFFIPEMRFWKQNGITSIESESFHNFSIGSIESATQNFTDSLDLNTTRAVAEIPRIVEEKVAVNTEKKRALFYEEPKIPEEKTYYIIAGSFERYGNAQALFTALTNEGRNPEILKSDGRYRVAISKFSDRNRALRELERLRREKPTESVWLLGL